MSKYWSRLTKWQTGLLVAVGLVLLTIGVVSLDNTPNGNLWGVVISLVGMTIAGFALLRLF